MKSSMNLILCIFIFLSIFPFPNFVRSDASDHRYKPGDFVPLYANKVGPFHNPRYAYDAVKPIIFCCEIVFWVWYLVQFCWLNSSADLKFVLYYLEERIFSMKLGHFIWILTIIVNGFPFHVGYYLFIIVFLVNFTVRPTGISTCPFVFQVLILFNFLRIWFSRWSCGCSAVNFLLIWIYRLFICSAFSVYLFRIKGLSVDITIKTKLKLFL